MVEKTTLQQIGGFITENQVYIASTFLTVCIVGFLLFVRRCFNGGRLCPSNAQMHGKTVIITGANSGIGKETAKELGRRGARIILACRNLDKAQAAAAEIRQEKDFKGEIIVKCVDLSSFKSIQDFVKGIINTEPRIHVLINNAGVLCPKSKTEDGFDMIFGTNHLGTFMLTNLLLQRLKESAPSRIVTVSGDAHKLGSGQMFWNDLQLDDPNAYAPWKAYCQSKLCNIFFSRQLSRKLEGSGVNTYVLHPGIIQTELPRHHLSNMIWIIRKIVVFFTSFVTKTPVQGAQTTVYCTVAEEVRHNTGLYYKDCRVASASPLAMDWDAAKRLWDISLQMIGWSENDFKNFHNGL